jgi:signal transduction histidine kinase
MTTDALRDEPLLHLFDTLAQHQLRNAGAEVAAAIAHALGTPLNVISGRAELIRQDPSNALAQVARIEEQVKKCATGLRQLVDFLAVPDTFVSPSPLASPRSASVEPTARSLAQGPEARVGVQVEQPESVMAVVLASSVLEDLVVLAQPIARANRTELEANLSALGAARVDRWHALSTLNALISLAIRYAGSNSRSDGAGAALPRVIVTAYAAAPLVIFEVLVPHLEVMEGWHLEHFQVRPPATASAEPYRTLSICAAIVRGRGGKLQVEAASADAAVIRFSCKAEA